MTVCGKKPMKSLICEVRHPNLGVERDNKRWNRGKGLMRIRRKRKSGRRGKERMETGVEADEDWNQWRRAKQNLESVGRHTLITECAVQEYE
jgi:hypothetical protein